MKYSSFCPAQIIKFNFDKRYGYENFTTSANANTDFKVSSNKKTIFGYVNSPSRLLVLNVDNLNYGEKQYIISRDSIKI